MREKLIELVALAMTCKDCLHHESCVYYGNSGVAYAVFYDEDKATDCPLFKDRSKWVEQKHGRWVERRHEGMGGGWYTLFHCPECDTPSAKPRNFCSFCGLKMTEGSEGDGNL